MEIRGWSVGRAATERAEQERHRVTPEMEREINEIAAKAAKRNRPIQIKTFEC
jgi:hypothetical protein